jgi:hypothetical protein
MSMDSSRQGLRDAKAPTPLFGLKNPTPLLAFLTFSLHRSAVFFSLERGHKPFSAASINSMLR